MEKFNRENQTEQIPQIEAEDVFRDFIPEEFQVDPFGYFEKYGKNIKSGDIQRDETGKIKEDPTAVKDLPVWHNHNKDELYTVGKKVNIAKSQVEKSGDPFYEYSIMEIAHEFGLPAPEPIAKIKHGDDHLIIMRKVEGIRWTKDGMEPINNSNLTEKDKKDMLFQAEKLMSEIQEKFEAIGLSRTWKLKDMIAQVDIPNKKVLGIVPTDWERTKINKEKLEAVRKEMVRN
ncbi:MAG TPA: hypothetical protein VL335_01195 [Candidatus Paceibacterota bacterium]|jgi:hypothetical protein|nr:hypothetical protein [Candidatus Paceibacterota bacterium]